jgi:hypothetical protein
VEIGEGNTQKKQKGEPTTASIGKAIKREAGSGK